MWLDRFFFLLQRHCFLLLIDNSSEWRQEEEMIHVHRHNFRSSCLSPANSGNDKRKLIFAFPMQSIRLPGKLVIQDRKREKQKKKMRYMSFFIIHEIFCPSIFKKKKKNSTNDLRIFKLSLIPFQNLTPKEETHLYLTLVLTWHNSDPLNIYLFSTDEDLYSLLKIVFQMFLSSTLHLWS